MNTLLQWFVTSSVLILAVLALRRLLGGRISPRVKYALWGVVLLRLLLPFQIPMPNLPTAADLTPEPTSLTQTTIPILPSSYSMEEVEAGQAPNLYLNDQGQVHTANSTGTVKPSADGQRAVFSLVWLSPAQLLLGVWSAGAVILALVLLGSNLRFYAKLRRRRTSLDLDDCPLPVYTVESLPSPCLFGLFRPCIYLTPQLTLDSPTRAHVLAHELTHYRQKDHIWSALRCLALALHWYNPLVWLAVALSKRDGELSCDAGAVKALGDEERIPYGRTLVSLVAQRSLRPEDLLSCSTSMVEGKGSIQERIAQLVKHPKAKKTALAAAVVLLALAAVFTFGGRTQDQTSSREGFLSSLENAQSVSLSLPSLSSSGYDPVTDEDLLSQVRELLGQAEAWDRENSVALGFQDLASSCCTVSFLNDKDTSAFYLYAGQGGDYVLARLDDSTAGSEPLAVLPEGTIFQLEDLFKTQLGRNQSTTRVEYPEFKNQLTELFLGVEECVLLNDTEDHQMEDWLTKYTSFYEIVHGVPWWLEDAPEGWYARAMDAGSWYTIIIPNSIVSQVQAICQEQAQYPSFDTVYSALGNTDTIQYAAMSAMSSRVGIDDPEVIKQITDLLLNESLNVPNPGRVTIGQELGVLTIPVDEQRNLTICLQEVEEGCLLSCAWTGSMWSFDSDTLPVLWVLPSGTAYEIYSIYEDWYADQPQTAGAPSRDWTHEQSFDQLAPGDEIVGANPVVVPSGGADFTYLINYTRTGLTLEFGLRSEDGTEYLQRVVGGDLSGTIPNIPAGSYTPFVRNTGDYTRYPIYGDDSQDYNATGTLVFLLETPPSSANSGLLNTMSNLQASDIQTIIFIGAPAADSWIQSLDKTALAELIRQASKQPLLASSESPNDEAGLDYALWSLELRLSSGQTLTLMAGREKNVVSLTETARLTNCAELYDLIREGVDSGQQIAVTDQAVLDTMEQVLEEELEKARALPEISDLGAVYQSAQLTSLHRLVSFDNLVDGSTVNIYGYDFGFVLDDLFHAPWAGGPWVDGQLRYHPDMGYQHLITVEQNGKVVQYVTTTSDFPLDPESYAASTQSQLSLGEYAALLLGLKG